MSYFLPLLSVTLRKRKALRSFSAMPPRNCQRTSGCISVSLLIGRSTVISKPAASRAFRCSCRSAYFLSAISIHRDVFVANDAPPLRLLALDELGELFRRAADDVAALALEPLAKRRSREQLDEGAVQPIQHRLRRSRGREHRGPRFRFEAGEGLADGRQVGIELGARSRADAEGGELAALHMLRDGAAALDQHHLHLSRDDILHGRAAAAVVDRDGIDARHILEELIGEPARGGRPRRAIVPVRTLLFRERDELLHRLHAQARMHDQHLRVAAYLHYRG